MGLRIEDLTIDPELRDVLPPLTDEEFEQLRENIVNRDKKLNNPIIVWGNTIVDGHNRYKILCEHPEIPYTVEQKDFSDKWAAIDWMITNQRGQRNLTEAQRTYLVGKLYEARKKSVGGDRGNQYAKEASAQNGPLPRTSEQIGKELGISHNQVKRSEYFAHGIDAIRETDPEAAKAILTGKLTPKKMDVAAIGKANEEDRPAMIQQIADGKRVAPVAVQTPDKIKAEVQTSYNGGGTEDYRKLRNRIAEEVATLYDEKPIMYTLEDLLNEILWNAESYISLLANTVENHMTLVKDNAEKVRAYISENVTMKIKQIEEEI